MSKRKQKTDEIFVQAQYLPVYNWAEKYYERLEERCKETGASIDNITSDTIKQVVLLELQNWLLETYPNV